MSTKLGVIKYNSNNSGGDWWVSTAGWEALERAGWIVHWVEEQTYKYGKHVSRPASSYEEPLKPCPRTGKKWLGAEACSAAKATNDPNAAVAEFERLTDNDSSDQGCNCCGPPHSFDYTDADGEKHYGESFTHSTKVTFYTDDEESE